MHLICIHLLLKVWESKQNERRNLFYKLINSTLSGPGSWPDFHLYAWFKIQGKDLQLFLQIGE